MNKLLAPCVAEAIGTFALIFVGVGSISVASQGGGLLAVAIAHGFTIAVMVAATAHISGGHLNPAVTFGLLLGRRIDAVTAFAYWISQLVGASLAGFLLVGLFGQKVVQNGTPALDNAHVTAMSGVVIEVILTFFLVFVIYGTAVDARCPRGVAPLMIGLTVTLDILFGGPHTGAAMNPARTFGPALASNFWANHWVYWVGPLAGGAIAALLYEGVLLPRGGTKRAE